MDFFNFNTVAEATQPSASIASSRERSLQSFRTNAKG